MLIKHLVKKCALYYSIFEKNLIIKIYEATKLLDGESFITIRTHTLVPHIGSATLRIYSIASIFFIFGKPILI